MKYKQLYFFISLILIIPGTISLLRFGLKPAIDFTGGTLWEISINTDKQVNETTIKEALSDHSNLISSIQKSNDSSWILRAKPLSENQHQLLKNSLITQFENVADISFQSVGPTLGKELLNQTLIAVLMAAIVILLFVAWRFKNFKFGLSAIIAMFHDSLILLGAFSLLGVLKGIEVDTLFVTAVLTILSFSVHDTIVVFDRIRETLRHHPKSSFEAIVNKSIAETLGRSVNNSMTIIFMLLALFLLGGETIKNFTLALLIGTISGTYSSTFTAAPLLVLFEDIKKKIS